MGQHRRRRAVYKDHPASDHDGVTGACGAKGDLPPMPLTRDLSPGGQCPFAKPVPADSNNYSIGRAGYALKNVRAVVLHIMDGKTGKISATNNYFQNPDAIVSAHFGIGKDGKIVQYVSINDTAYAVGLGVQNGQWMTPGPVETRRPVTPRWPDIVRFDNPNLYTISIEHEGQPDDVWTPQMRASNLRLLKWIAAQIGPGFRYSPKHTLIAHGDINPVDRPFCPGPHVDFDAIAAAANEDDNDDQMMMQSSTSLLLQSLSSLKEEIAQKLGEMPGNPLSLVEERTGMYVIKTPTALINFVDSTVVKELPSGEVVDVHGFVDLHSRRWFISKFSWDRQIPNFFAAEATTRLP